MAKKKMDSVLSRYREVSPRAVLLTSLSVIVIVMAAFRYAEERREEVFREAAEGEYRRFLQEAGVFSGGDVGVLAINLTRAREFAPTGKMGIEIRIEVYGREELHLKKGPLSGPYEYRRETRLLLYDSGVYLPAILEFRVRGEAP
ncbi:MAG: hypothetical protein J7K08_02595 [Thermoplasmata archaeon]|nr:hypothetical protein [Thermoplasmata archaeon]RLF56224.1 MAG: hypothetical protein DRN28_01065 [Thermoplasmata archaeon]HDD60752.1 hypothetical protein [Euryarchaeota archaeon]